MMSCTNGTGIVKTLNVIHTQPAKLLRIKSKFKLIPPPKLYILLTIVMHKHRKDKEKT